MSAPALAQCPTCARLEEENEELRFELDQLRGHDAILPYVQHFRLTRTQARLLHYLCQQHKAARMQILDAVYGHLPDADQPQIKILDVHLCHIRKKLTPFGITIENIWGYGYRLSPENRQRITAIIQEEKTNVETSQEAGSRGNGRPSNQRPAAR